MDTTNVTPTSQDPFGRKWVALSLLGCVISIWLIITALGLTRTFNEAIELPIMVRYDQTAEQSFQADAGVTVLGHDSIKVQFQSRLGRFLHGFFLGLTLTLGIAWIGLQLLKFFREVRAGRPFDAGNPVRVKRIGWTVFAAGPVYGIVQFVLGLIYINRLWPAAPPEVTLDFHLELVLMGIVILIIGQIFEAGCKLQREVDLTI